MISVSLLCFPSPHLWGPLEKAGYEGHQKLDPCPSPTLCCATPPASRSFTLLALEHFGSRTPLLPPAGTVVFLAHLQTAQMHLINKECAVLQSSCGMAVRGWQTGVHSAMEAGRVVQGVLAGMGGVP